MKKILLIFVCLLFSVPLRATNYYVSKSTGSDSNPGTKASPWAHIPGMKSWTGSHVPIAGDTFILKGCDVWTNSDFPILWKWSGSSGNLITIGGEDITWYNTSNCPSAWNRPVFDAQLSTITPDNTFMMAAAVSATSYGVLDNIELKGFFCVSTGCTNGAGSMVQSYESTTYWTFSNLYFHGWNVGVETTKCIPFAASPIATGTTFTRNIIDGSDTPGYNTGNATCYATYPIVVPHMTYNVIHDIANGIVGYAENSTGTAEVGGNLIYNIQQNAGGSHPNCIEYVGAGTYYTHDNICHDINPAGALIFSYGYTNSYNYYWNNVDYNNPNANPIGPSSNALASNLNFWAWNNTILTKAGLPCFLTDTPYKTFTTVAIQNNFCITTSGAVTQLPYPGATATVTGNTILTPTQATTDGYTASQTPYVYYPISGGSPTVGAGGNLTGSCSGSLASLCKDTTYAVSYNQTSQTVTVPGRTSLTRPASGAWDSGAYQFSGLPTVVTPVISPASGTYGTPITVTITDGTLGAYICWTANGTTPIPNGSGGCSNGSLYSAPFSQSVPASVQAAAGAAGYSNSATASVSYTLGGAPVITSASSASGTVGVAFSYQITATNSPTSYSASGLPSGLSVNTSTGLISGTPSSPGTSSATVGATNSSGTGTAPLTITISTIVTNGNCSVSIIFIGP